MELAKPGSFFNRHRDSGQTATFGAKTRGVPVYVEWADLDGQRALIMVEAIGPAGGSLTTKRLWALSPSGDVLFAGTR